MFSPKTTHRSSRSIRQAWNRLCGRFQKGKLRLIGGYVVPAIICFGGSMAQAQSTEWTANSGFFFSDLNWNNDVPNSSTLAIFGGNGGTITFGGTGFSRGFTIREGGIGGFTQNFVFSLAGGTYDARGGTSRISSNGTPNNSNLTVQGGTMLTDALLVGDGTGNRGLLSVNSGATVTSSSLVVGNNASIGNPFVRDGGEYNITGNALFGTTNGAGNLRLINGGRMNVDGICEFGRAGSTSSSIFIEHSNGSQNILTTFMATMAGATGGTANVDIQGNGRWNVGQDLFIGGSSGSALGDGSLTINGQSNALNLDVGRELKIWNSAGSSLVMQRGQIHTESLTRFGTLTWTGGKIHVDGGLFTNGTAINSLILNSGSSTSQADQVHLLLSNNASTTNISSLVVGAANRASMTVSSGATMNNTSAFVGFNGGGIGAATIDGGNWNVTGGLTVGGAGNGSALITNGGTVNSVSGEIGGSSGGNGTVTVSSAASSWNMTGALEVGSSSQGTLNINAGAQVNSLSGVIGVNSIGNGAVVLNGNNSTWTTPNATVGQSGTGMLNVNGGRGQFALLTLAENAGSNGAVNLSSGNINSTTTMVGGTTSAAGGAGTLNVSGGTFVNDGELKIWNSPGSQFALNGGIVTTDSLTRLGGLALNSGTLKVIGGTLDNGTSATNLALNGTQPTSNVSLILQNAGTSTSDIANLSVGGVGFGSVQVQQGAVLTSTSATLGGGQGASVQVVGSGSVWGSGAVTANNTGIGTLINITSGGAINSSSVNLNANTSASINGNGSAWNTTGAVNIGTNGASSVQVQSGGRLDTGVVTLGTNTGSNGQLELTGNSTIGDFSGLNVGGAGVGEVTIHNGADVLTGFFNAGNSAGGSGTATIQGSGTTVNSGGLSFGFNSTGQLILSGGATLSSGNGTLGGNATGNGNVLVQGTGTSWSIAGGDLIVGNSGIGNLQVSTAATMTHTGVRIGNFAGSNGTATVSGLGTQIAGNGLTAIGLGGSGTLRIESGAKFVGGITTIGSAAGGTGTVDVTGTGSTWQTNGLFIGGSTSAAAGTGTATIGSQTKLNAFGTIKIWEPGRLNVDGGTVVSAGFDRRGIFSFTDGSFTVQTGTFNNNGGNFSLGGGTEDDHSIFRLNNSAHGTNLNIVLVGNSSRGTMELLAGSDLAATVVTVGQSAGGIGTLRLNGNSSITASSFMTLGTAGNGSLILENGSSATVAGNLNLNVGGMLRLDDGTVNLGTSLVFGGGVFDWRSGTVNFTNTANLGSSQLTSLLGSSHQIAGGRTLSGTNLTLSSQTSLAGGNWTGGNLVVNTTVQANQGILNATDQLTINSGKSLIIRDTAEVNAVNGILNNGSLVFEDNLVATSGGTLTNNGILRGSGYVANFVNNGLAGRIHVTDSQRLELNQLDNSGEVSVINGELVFNGLVNNFAGTSMVSARDGIVRFHGDMINQGGMAFTFGTSDVFGKVVNDERGIINVSGGGNVTFYDDLRQNGTMQVAAIGNSVSTAVLFGEFSGDGGFVGGGDVYALGDMRPGNSPASILMDGNLFFGNTTNTLLELGGLELGAFDQLRISGNFSVAGDLFVDLINGHHLGLGEEYLVMDVGGLLAGSFVGLGEGDLVGQFGYVHLFITYQAGDGNDIALFTAIPEPSSLGIVAVVGLLGLAVRRSRQPSAA